MIIFSYVQPENMITRFALFPKLLALEIAPQNHPLSNMNIEGNIQSHAVTSLMMLSFHFTQFAI